MPRRLRVAVVLLVALATPTGAAWAHANLVRTVPANGAVLSVAPAEVRIVFDDVVRAGPGVEAVRNGGGSILRGSASVRGGRTLVLPLRGGLPDGDYSVRWSIVSDDGHLESGVLAFAVGEGRSPPRSTLSAERTGPSAESVSARWLFLVGVLGAVGLALFAFAAGYEAEAEERVALLLSGFAAVAAIGAAEEVHRVGLATRDGTALAAGLAVAVLVALLAGSATLERRALRPALLAALCLVPVPSVAGHALDAGLSRLNVVADVLHVGAAAAWVGVLVGLAALPRSSRAVRRGGLLAAAAVLVLGATGIVRASVELVSVSQLWSTSYGRALLVKAGLLLAALGAGWLVRGRVALRAAVELALVAGLVVAVAVLVQLRPGRNAVAARQAPVEASEPSPQPPPPPAGAVVLAREAGPLGIALAVQPHRLTATVLSPAGGGLSGLRVRFLPGAVAATPCGSGCYTAAVTPGRTVAVEAAGFEGTHAASFVLPAHPRDAGSIVRRVRQAFRALRSVDYTERLASDPTHAIVTRWRLERPDRLTYAIAGGAQAIVVGDRRWDRDSPAKPWQESAQTPLQQPATAWTYAANAHVLSESGSTLTVSFADPTIPAFFTLIVDRRTLRPRLMRMTAAAHFMTDRYLGFNGPRAIRPPG